MSGACEGQYTLFDSALDAAEPAPRRRKPRYPICASPTSTKIPVHPTSLS